MCCQIGGVAGGDRQHLGLASSRLVDGRELSGNLDAARDDRGDLSRVEHAIADMSFLSVSVVRTFETDLAYVEERVLLIW